MTCLPDSLKEERRDRGILAEAPVLPRSAGLAGQELLDCIDVGEVFRLALLGNELIGAVVGGARIYAPCLVQPVALPGRHAPQPVSPDSLVLLHVGKHTKTYAERYAGLISSAMLRNMTNDRDELEHTYNWTCFLVSSHSVPRDDAAPECQACRLEITREIVTRKHAAESVLMAHKIRLGSGHNLTLGQIEALAELVKTWED